MQHIPARLISLEETPGIGIAEASSKLRAARIVGLKWVEEIACLRRGRERHRKGLQTEGSLETSPPFALSPLEKKCPVIGSLKTNRGINVLASANGRSVTRQWLPAARTHHLETTGAELEGRLCAPFFRGPLIQGNAILALPVSSLGW